MRRGISKKIDACKENVLVSIKKPCNLLVQTKISFLQKVFIYSSIQQNLIKQQITNNKTIKTDNHTI
jgi:hypothetical protein